MPQLDGTSLSVARQDQAVKALAPNMMTASVTELQEYWETGLVIDLAGLINGFRGNDISKAALSVNRTHGTPGLGAAGVIADLALLYANGYEYCVNTPAEGRGDMSNTSRAVLLDGSMPSGATRSKEKKTGYNVVDAGVANKNSKNSINLKWLGSQLTEGTTWASTSLVTVLNPHRAMWRFAHVPTARLLEMHKASKQGPDQYGIQVPLGRDGHLRDGGEVGKLFKPFMRNTVADHLLDLVGKW